MELMRPLLVALGRLFGSSACTVERRAGFFQGRTPSENQGLSEIIQRAPNDATAYHNRALRMDWGGYRQCESRTTPRY